jgi:hypothetical protein
LAEAESKRFNFDRPNGGDSGLSEELMAYGINRFLTTHTGSLPRPDDLIRAMFAKEEGVPVDRTGLAAKIRAAVAGVVKKQVDSGIDLGQLDRQKREWPRYSQWVGIINITLEKPTMRSARARLATMKPTRGQSSPGCHSTFATTHGGF